jgi:hypothetical protein
MTDYTKLATEALERAEKATPGDWIDLPKETPKSHRRVVAGVSGMHEHHVALVGTDDNADFIAAARTDVPTLAHAVLELVAALETIVDGVYEGTGLTSDEMRHTARQALKGESG